MKFFSILFLTLSLSVGIFADNSFQQPEIKYGLGLATDYDIFSGMQKFDNDVIGLGASNRILFTVISNNIKFETQAMILRASRSREKSSKSFLVGDISFGGYASTIIGNNFNLYYGAKLGLTFSTSSYSYDDDSDSDKELYSYYITPTIGGEYFLVPNFSISGEVGLKIIIFDKNDTDSSEYYAYTTSSLLIKFYF